MEISEISVSMNQTSLMAAVSTAVLGMSLDMVETSGENMVKMMELSVNPNIGSNIDVSVQFADLKRKTRENFIWLSLVFLLLFTTG